MPGRPQLQTLWQMALTTKCHPFEDLASHPGALGGTWWHLVAVLKKNLCTTQSPMLRPVEQVPECARLQPDNNALEHQVAGRLLIPQLVLVQTSSHPGHQEVQSRANLLWTKTPTRFCPDAPKPHRHPNMAPCTLPPRRLHEKPRTRKAQN